MSGSTVNKRMPLGAAIRQQLDRLRGLIRRYVLSQLLIALLSFVAICFWFFGLLDYAPITFGASESPQSARATMLALMGAGCLYIVYRLGIRKLFVSWPDKTLALLIERKYPEFKSSLVTTVDYHSGKLEDAPDSDRNLGDSMFALAAEQAEKLAQQIDSATALNWFRLRAQWILLALILIGSLGLALWNPGWTALWANRFFALSNVAWPRSTLIRADGIELEIPAFTGQVDRSRMLQPFQNNSVKVPRGREGIFRVSANTNKVVPEQCAVNYQLADGATGRAKMRRLPLPEDGWQRFTLDGPPFDSIDQDIELSVLAGDMRLSGYSLQVVDSPLVTQLQLRVTYPDYLKATDNRFETETLTYQTGLRIPEGSKVTLLGQANKPLSKVEYGLSTGGETENSNSQISSIELSGLEFEIPIGQIQENRLIEFRLWDQDNLCSDRIQQYVLTVLVDQMPTADLLAKGIGTAITPIAMLPIQAKFDDDHGVRIGSLEMRVDQGAPLVVPLASAPQGQAEVVIDLRDLKEQGRLIADVGKSLLLNLTLDDYFDLSQPGHKTQSVPLTLNVVTPDALLILLEKREFAMRSRLELMISELTQMRELLEKMQSAESAAKSKSAGTTRFPATVQDPATNTVQDSQPENEEADALRAGRMQQLRAQQSTMQADKSLAELRGIEKEIGQIRQELINNRIDSTDRQQRLEEKIRQPIVDLVEGTFPQLSRNLKELETVVASQTEVGNRITGNIQLTDTVLLSLQDILKNMVDIQDFNEIIDMVRGIMDQQDELLKKTKDEQKKQVLDLFK
jgi:hypothetical protein